MYFIIFHNIIDFSLSFLDLGQKVNETVVLEELVAIAQENKERRNMYKETAARQEQLLHILENIANQM